VLERHLLRLGSGVERLAEFTGGRDFSKFGRVNFTLSRRQELLAEVRASAVVFVPTLYAFASNLYVNVHVPSSPRQGTLLGHGKVAVYALFSLFFFFFTGDAALLLSTHISTYSRGYVMYVIAIHAPGPAPRRLSPNRRRVGVERHERRGLHLRGRGLLPPLPRNKPRRAVQGSAFRGAQPLYDHNVWFILPASYVCLHRNTEV